VMKILNYVQLIDSVRRDKIELVRVEFGSV